MTKDEQWLLDEKYKGVKSEAFHADCARLEAGEPLAYVIGTIPFLNCTIWLESNPLIPRPETEFWVEQAIAAIKTKHTMDNPSKTIKVLDLCAGSGCIGIAVAKAVSHASVDFIELDPLHLTTISHNLTANDIGRTHCKLYAGDLFTNINERYDFILSNPPYIDPVLDRAEPSVKNHEPKKALYGGVGGMEIIERIIATSPTHLVSGGELWLEHEPEQSKKIAELGTQHGFTTTTHTDQYYIERFSRLVLQ